MKLANWLNAISFITCKPSTHRDYWRFYLFLQNTNLRRFTFSESTADFVLANQCQNFDQIPSAKLVGAFLTACCGDNELLLLSGSEKLRPLAISFIKSLASCTVQDDEQHQELHAPNKLSLKSK
jgi:hypothetical protein